MFIINLVSWSVIRGMIPDDKDDCADMMNQDINQATQGPDVVWQFTWGNVSRNLLPPDRELIIDKSIATTKVKLDKILTLG